MRGTKWKIVKRCTWKKNVFCFCTNIPPATLISLFVCMNEERFLRYILRSPLSSQRGVGNSSECGKKKGTMFLTLLLPFCLSLAVGVRLLVSKSLSSRKGSVTLSPGSRLSNKFFSVYISTHQRGKSPGVLMMAFPPGKSSVVGSLSRFTGPPKTQLWRT